MAVFHIADTSGPSRSLERELAWLAEQGALDVVLPGDGSVADALPEEATVLLGDYEALTSPSRRNGGLLTQARELVGEVRGFRALIAERRPQLIVAVTAMLPAVSLAARLERVPLLVYCGEFFDRGYGAGRIRAWAGRRLAALTGRLASGLIACSELVARQFDRLPPGRVEVVYPPHDPARYRDGDGAAVRSRFGIAADAPVLASVGYVTEGRGQDVLVRAMPEVLSEFPGARYVLVGDPFPRPQDLAYREHLVRLIAELGLERSITLAGHLEDVADVYAAADLVVNPARFNEPFGRVPFEAALAGRPAVVTRVGAIPELLRDGESALIVEPDDPSALAGAIVRLLRDPELREALAVGARELVAANMLPEHSLAGFKRAVRATESA